MLMNSYKQSLYIVIIRICANLLMLGAVFIAMYQASLWPAWPSEAVFCLFFFGLTIPGWLIAWQLIRFVRRTFPAEYKSLVYLPGFGEQLISWRLAKKKPLPPFKVTGTFPEASEN